MSEPAGKGRPILNRGEPYLVMGVARSGTTLLRTLLSLHPEVCISDEAHFLRPFVGTQAAPFSEDAFERAWDTAAPHIARKDFRVDHDHVLSAVRASGELSGRTFLDAVLATDATARGKVRYGAKVPVYFDPTESLLAWFPRTRIVWIVRDPRANVASTVSRRWGVNRTIRELCLRWRRETYDQVTAYLEDPRVLWIRYEDVVGEPEAHLRRVCSFLGIEFAEAMARPEPGQVRMNTSFPDRVAADEGVISRRRNETWRTALSARQVRRIERLCREPMAHFGYTPLPRPPGLAGFAYVIGQRLRPLRLRLSRLLRRTGRRAPSAPRPA
jgi:hypothetical protein